jgi:hypothetical protein
MKVRDVFHSEKSPLPPFGHGGGAGSKPPSGENLRPTAEECNGLSKAYSMAADRVRKSIHKRLCFLLVQPAYLRRWRTRSTRVKDVGGGIALTRCNPLGEVAADNRYCHPKRPRAYRIGSIRPTTNLGGKSGVAAKDARTAELLLADKHPGKLPQASAGCPADEVAKLGARSDPSWKRPKLSLLRPMSSLAQGA